MGTPSPRHSHPAALGMLPSTFLSWGKAGTSPAGAVPILSRPERSALLWFDAPHPLAAPCSLTEGGLPSLWLGVRCLPPSAAATPSSRGTWGEHLREGLQHPGTPTERWKWSPPALSCPKVGLGSAAGVWVSWQGVQVCLAGCAGVPWVPGSPLAQPQKSQGDTRLCVVNSTSPGELLPAEAEHKPP